MVVGVGSGVGLRLGVGLGLRFGCDGEMRLWLVIGEMVTAGGRDGVGGRVVAGCRISLRVVGSVGVGCWA